MWLSYPLVSYSSLYRYKAVLCSFRIPLPVAVQTIVRLRRHLPLHSSPCRLPLCPKVLNQVLGLFELREAGIRSPALAMQQACPLLGTVDGVTPALLVEQRGQPLFVPGHRVCLVRRQASNIILSSGWMNLACRSYYCTKRRYRRLKAQEKSEIMATIEERLKRVIVAWLDVNERDVVPEASFLEDLDGDSLDLLDLMMAIEEEFSIDISPDEMEQLETV
jgi:acyl carrier protein